MISHLLKEKSILLVLFFLICSIPVFAFADAEKIFKENNKSVVVVVTFDKDGNPQSQGSGFIVKSDGVVVTNYHVISNAVDIKIKAGNMILDVEGIIHMDKENDIVILKAQGVNLPTVRLGDIEKEVVGEKIYVISSPKGLENTISDGLLSGIREITDKKKILQITAPISPGSSGSPVFNRKGEVIGIATFLLKEAQNINFAMPVNLLINKIGNNIISKLQDIVTEDYTKTAEYWFNLGNAYGNAKKHREAANAYEQAIIIKPDASGAYYNLGIEYGILGKHQKAADAYEQSTIIYPDYADAYYNLGFEYGKLGKYQESVNAYKQAIIIKPDYADAYYNLGFEYGKLGKYQESANAYKQAIRIKPDSARALSGLGRAYGRLKKYREGVNAYKQAIRIKPDDAEAHFSLGLMYGMLDKNQKAVDAFKQAIRIKPDYADAHYFLGQLYLGTQDHGSAFDKYKILKELDKEQANKLFNSIYP